MLGRIINGLIRGWKAHGVEEIDMYTGLLLCMLTTKAQMLLTNRSVCTLVVVLCCTHFPSWPCKLNSLQGHIVYT